MKYFNVPLSLAAAVLAAGLASAPAQTADALRIFTAIEVEYDTMIGRSYQLQGSLNLTDWVNIGNPVIGHGRTVRQVFSTRSGDDVSFAAYRLMIEDGPTNGLAPDTFAGLTLNLDDQPGGDLLEFTTETTGVDQGVSQDPFTYVYTRLTADRGQVELVPAGRNDARKDVYVFTFTAPGIGTWMRDEFRNGQLKDRDQGVFSVVSGNPPGGGTNQPPAGTNSVPAEPPATLAGLVYLFQSGLTPDRLEFTTDTAGVEFEDNPRPNDDDPHKPFNYTYSLLTAETASLIVNLPNNRRDEYDLTFTSGAQGTFVRREFRDGVLDDTDRGTFSPSSMPPVIDPGTINPPSTDQPPSAPVGFTYTMQSGAVPERLVFQTATAGVEFDDSAPSQFTYTYTATGENTVSLVLRFKPDKWDEYDLTFTSGTGGTFVRREFDKNVLKDTDSGPFTIAPTL